MASVTRNPRPLFVTTLPPAADGMEVFYRADNTNGVIWHLRARSVANGGSATYPWEFVGGGALTARVTAAVTATTATMTAKTGGPSFTLPLAGKYKLSYGALIAASALGAYAVTAPFYNGAAMGSGSENEIGQGAANVYIGCAGETYETVTTAAQTLELYYRSDSGTGTFIRRFLAATPIRVG